MHKLISFILADLLALCIAHPAVAQEYRATYQGYLVVSEETAYLDGVAIPKAIFEKSVRQFCPDKTPCILDAQGKMVEGELDEVFEVSKVFSAKSYAMQENELTVTNLVLTESEEPSYIEGYLKGSKEQTTIVGHHAFYENCGDDWEHNAQCPVKKNASYKVKYVVSSLTKHGQSAPEYSYNALVDIEAANTNRN